MTHDAVLLNAGRGFGKSTAGAIQAIIEANKVTKGAVIAPTYPMLRDASMAEFFRWLPRQAVGDWNKSEKNLILVNGSEIAFRSADDPNSLRGPNRDWIWFDEPRNLRTREPFDVAYAQMRQTPKLWMTSTPAGIFHWIYDLFVANPITNSAVINAKTSENPHNAPDFYAKLKALYTGAFAAQELDAAWVSFEGLVYANFVLDENVTTDAEYNPNLPVIWGVDDGYALGQGVGSASYHPRVFLLAQETAQGGIHVFAEYVRCLELEEQSIANVKALGYPLPHVAYIDSSAAQLKARLWNDGIQTISSTHVVSEGIKNVRRLVGDGNGKRLLKIHPRCKEIIREFQSYRVDDASKAISAGEPKPLKLDDHGLDALRYVCWHLRYGE